MLKKILKPYADKRLFTFFQSQKRITRIYTLKNSKSVGILWNPADERGIEAYESLHKTLQLKGIKSKGVAHVHSGRELELLKTITHSGFLHNRNIRWFGKPMTDSGLNFIQEPFDILIDLSIVKTIALQYIVVHSQATFKVGWQGIEPNYYDLNIEVNERPQCLYLLEQIIYYLENINEQDLNTL